MAYLSNLRPKPGSVRDTKRLGRGNSSGQGKTAGKGEKGQNSRTGVTHRRGFEGGQLPLQRRVPKRGFSNPFRQTIPIINLSDLVGIVSEGVIVDLEFLKKKGLLKGKSLKFKVLGDGLASKNMVIKASSFSNAARSKIIEKGGKAELA